MTSKGFNFGSSNNSSAPSVGTYSNGRPSFNEPMTDSSDSEGDDGDLTQHIGVAVGGEPIELLASFIGSTTLAKGVTWTVIGDVTDSTTTVAKCVEKFVIPGLRNGLPVKDENVDQLVGLWMLLYPGDMHHDIDKMSHAMK